MEDLEAALNFLVETKKKGGVILFVGTNIAAKDITQKIAKNLNMPYVTERWLGGTFTNFSTISRRIKYSEILKARRKAASLKNTQNMKL